MSSDKANTTGAADPRGHLNSIPEIQNRKVSPGTDNPFSNFEHAPKIVGDPWEVLLKPELEADTVRCNAWKDEVQNLLIFAGLFSAVVTAFVVESYKCLQPDPNDAIIGLLFQIANGSAPFPPSVTSAFSQTSSSVRINVFWFISLILSLTTVLIGTISLQWLREHQSYPNFSAKEKLAILHMRLESLDVWLIPQIFATLPVLLQIALALFLAGLIDFVLPLGQMLSTPVSVLVGFTLFFLVVTTALPIFQGFLLLTGIYPHRKPPSPCAFKSPQSRVILAALTPFLKLLSYLISRVYQFLSFPSIFRRYSVLPFLSQTFQQQTWPAFDCKWLSLRDAYHQCILDRDGDLYYHLQCWQKSFPLSDISQYFVQVVQERRAAKHTESFFHAAIQCFQAISTSIWLEPSESHHLPVQRKDRRHNYFKQLYIPLDRSSCYCSLSDYLLHGGIYEYKNYVDPTLHNRYLLSFIRQHDRLFCQAEVLGFLNTLLSRHTSFSLAQYQLELWSQLMCSRYKPTPLTPPVNDSTGRLDSTCRLDLCLVPIPICRDYSGQELINLTNFVSAVFKLASSQRVSMHSLDRTAISLWQRSEIATKISSLGGVVGVLFQSLEPSYRPEILAQFLSTFMSISTHLKPFSNSIMNSEIDDAPSVLFYLSSIFVWAVLERMVCGLKYNWTKTASLHKVSASIELRSLVAALQQYRAWTSANSHTQNNILKAHFQDQDYSWSTSDDVERFSAQWWNLLFENANIVFEAQGVHALESASGDTSINGNFVIHSSTVAGTATINHPSLAPPTLNTDTTDTAVSEDEVISSASFISNTEDWDQDKKQQPIRELPATANDASVISNSPFSHSQPSLCDPFPTQSSGGHHGAAEVTVPHSLPLPEVAAVAEEQHQIETNMANTSAPIYNVGPHSTIEFGSAVITEQIEVVQTSSPPSRELFQDGPRAEDAIIRID